MSVKEEASDTYTLQNDNLSVIITKKPHCQVKMDITVQPHATEAAYQKAIKQVSKEVSIPGFRKGKAPNQMILEKYQSAIKEEFLNLVLQTSFNEALHLAHLHPLKDGSVKRPVVKECTREKGAHVIIEFESRISIPDIHLDQITVKKLPLLEVTQKEKDEAMEQLLHRLATYTPVQDRAVKKGDFINVDISLQGDFPRDVENPRVMVDSKYMPSWMIDKVIGLKIGESVEGETEPTEEQENDGRPFHPVPFKATLKAIWEGEMPAIDDELAKKVGVQTIDELKEKMAERLLQTAQTDLFEQQADLIEAALLEKYPIDVPKSYLDEEKESRLDGYLAPLYEKKLDDYIEQNRAAIEAQVEEESLIRLRIYFLLHALASKNNLKPTEEELSKEFARQSSLMAVGRSRISPYTEREQLYNQLFNLALEHKVKQFMMDNVNLV